MFNQYLTLDQIVHAGGTEQIKQELNSYPLYTWMVRMFGFREIGILALNEQKEESGRYASLNNEQGEITEILSAFTNPTITVQAEEKYLVEILHRAEHIKEHPAVAIMRYWGAFSLVQGQYRGIHHYVVHFFAHFIDEKKSSHPQPLS